MTDTNAKRESASNRVTCQICYGQNGEHQAGCASSNKTSNERYRAVHRPVSGGTFYWFVQVKRWWGWQTTRWCGEEAEAQKYLNKLAYPPKALVPKRQDETSAQQENSNG